MKEVKFKPEGASVEAVLEGLNEDKKDMIGMIVIVFDREGFHRRNSGMDYMTMVSALRRTEHQALCDWEKQNEES